MTIQPITTVICVAAFASCGSCSTEDDGRAGGKDANIGEYTVAEIEPPYTTGESQLEVTS